jgi:hypothetical protein
MTIAPLKPGPRLGLYEALLSLTLGFGVAGVVLVHDLILWPFVIINRFLTPILLHQGGLSLSAGIAFTATASAYAAFVFLVLHFSARSSLTQNFIRSWSGLVLFVAPWLCWLLMAAPYSPAVYVLLALETAVCTFSAFCLRRKTRGLGWQLTLIVVTHWGLWIWLFWRGIPNHAVILIPGSAAVSSVAWLYRRRLDGVCAGPGRVA